MFSKPKTLYLFLSGLFIINVLVAEFIGVKIFDLNETLNLNLSPIRLFGQDMQWQFTAGILIWPVVFVLTDIINDYFGVKGVKQLSYLAIFLIGYAFVMVFIAIKMAPADWWLTIGSKQRCLCFQTHQKVVWRKTHLDTSDYFYFTFSVYR